MSVILLALVSTLGGAPPQKWPARFYIGVDRYGARVAHSTSCREVKAHRSAHDVYVYERRHVGACK